MPPRVGVNGAVVKPRSSTNPQRRARPTASKVIDLTRESSGESPGETSGEPSPEEEDAEDAPEESPDDSDESPDETSGETAPEEEEAEDAPERHRERSDGARRYASSSAGIQERVSGADQRALGWPSAHNHQPVARLGQGCILEDNFVVTSLHHRPWGIGDHNTTVGVFFTEEEAKTAAHMHFQQVKREADGWESEWHRCEGDGMLQLRGIIEEGERDSETYTASVKRVQQKRPVAVQPRVQSAAQPKTRLIKHRYVYVVKEEQRMNVGEDDPQGFCNESGDLNSVEIHGIYLELDAANEYTREIYEGMHHGNEVETVIDTLENSMATILVENREQMMTYSFTVERRSLQ